MSVKITSDDKGFVIPHKDLHFDHVWLGPAQLAKAVSSQSSKTNPIKIKQTNGATEQPTLSLAFMQSSIQCCSPSVLCMIELESEKIMWIMIINLWKN